MRCSSYCTASEYKVDDLTKYLVNLGYVTTQFDDVVYAKLENEAHLDLFIFPFGCLSMWGGNQQEEESILDKVKQFEIESVEDVAYDHISFEYHESKKVKENSKTFIDEERNKIVLGDESVHTKLSMSHALAQSVKLMILEASVSQILEKAAPIQKELARTGSVSLSKKEISKQIGNLFNERYSINLHSDILDTPEFFWRRPSYEPLYLMTAEFQDISVRQGIMNHRLDIIQELYNVLSNELNYKHSARLEITIVVLIAIEVMLALSHTDFSSKILSLL